MLIIIRCPSYFIHFSSAMRVLEAALCKSFKQAFLGFFCQRLLPLDLYVYIKWLTERQG